MFLGIHLLFNFLKIMIETHIPDIDTEALMKRINEGVQKTSERSSSCIADEISLLAAQDASALEEKTIPIKEWYSIHDFLEFSNKNFILNAFRALMHRDPQGGEFEHLLGLLERGELSRTGVLCTIRFSLEGKKKNVKVKGLYLPFFIKRLGRIPVIGKLVDIFSCTYRLPTLFKNVLQLNNSVHQIQELKLDKVRHVEGLRTIVMAINELEEKFISWQQQSGHQTDILLRGFSEKQQAEYDCFLSDLQGIKDNALADLDELKAKAISAVNEEFTVRLSGMVTMQRELQQLEQNICSKFKSGATIIREQEQEAEAASSSSCFVPLDSVYLALENNFRGKPEDIGKRLQVYLPYVLEVVQTLPDGEALDVGCGRGEWLELMRDEKIAAVGVDLNPRMLERARELGLKVICDDLFNYFQGVGDDSLAIISGFHIVEHLSFENLVQLIDEGLRSLQVGGMAIFETPNPENLLTGACNFYIDPTHKNPLPPQLLEFLLKARGFSRVEILRLHPNDSIRLNEQVVQDMLFGPQDYAVLGWK